MPVSRSPVPPSPGFFGKVPARGDFLVRRIPADFQATWEAWLAGFVAAARRALGNEWPHAWLTAPLWHFSLGSNVVPLGGAAGVLIASADRVGRFFPFSIVGAAVASPHADRARLDGWAGSAEALALAALEDDFDPDALDQALRDLGGPPALPGAAGTTGHWPLALEGDWPAWTAAPPGAWQPPGPDQSAWWCRGSDRMGALHLRCQGLPDASLSASMASGGFDRPG